MKRFEHEYEVSEVSAARSGLARAPGVPLERAEPELLTLAEIEIVSGGPEGEVGAGVIPPH